MTCKLCGSATESFGELRVLGRHRARYARCTTCGYVAAGDPHWLEEAYADRAIAALDTGIVVRNLWLAGAVDLLLRRHFRKVRTALDWGGGTGLFVRLMRDRGHDFRWADPYCDNLFAAGFEADEHTPYDLATCFEVFEHLPDPLPAFRQLTRRAPILIFSTELLPERNNRPGEWYYYSPETGQHIGFFTALSLQTVAKKLGLHFASDGRMLHVLAQTPVASRWLRRLPRMRRNRWWDRLRGRPKKLTWQDAEILTRRLRAQQSADAQRR